MLALMGWTAGLVMVMAAIARAAVPVVHLEEVARGLQNPVFFGSDGTERNFIVEQEGAIRLLRDGTVVARPYLDIRSRVSAGGECGLLSVAFHRDFARNGCFYVDYTERKPGLRTVIAEYRAEPGADRVDPKTERVLLTIDQPYPNHNGGQVAFGPDGMLYIGMGDGGAGDDPENRAQNPQVLLGKVLRIEVKPGEGKYFIPKDNPFVKDARVRPEIWTMGMRNPWRFSFDRKTGLCYAGDVGQDTWEEIDILKSGGNYGWNVREGLHPFKKRRGAPAGPLFDAAGPAVDPIKEYKHDVGLSVTGGYVYRGRAIPELVGWYVYADYAKGQIWGLKYEAGKVTEEGLLMKMRGQPASFGEDAAGEIYVCDYGRGVVSKIVAGNK